MMACVFLKRLSRSCNKQFHCLTLMHHSLMATPARGEGGWWSVRRQTWDQITTAVGGPAERDYRLVFDALDALGGPAAEWVPVGAGEN
jgi:hypothetical protein